MKEEDITVKYHHFSIEYVVYMNYMPIHIFFKIGELTNIENFKYRISHFTSSKEDILKPYSEFFVRYFNEVMRKSYVRYGL